jgi:hypothetical protein
MRGYSFLFQADVHEPNQNTGQSCAIAALSGSTNESFEEVTKGSSKAPTGSNSKGKECITKYYKQLGLKAPGGSISSRAIAGEPNSQSRRSQVEPASREAGQEFWDLQKRQDCKPNILLFARGTLEAGTMGITVGPALQSALNRQGPGKWRSEGVKYTADIAGDDCIGFPGGIKCVDQLAKIASQCPSSKFFLSGYSQGAMVARICTAFSKDDVKQRIKVSSVAFRSLMAEIKTVLLLGCRRVRRPVQRCLDKRISQGGYQNILRRHRRCLPGQVLDYCCASWLYGGYLSDGGSQVDESESSMIVM